VLSGGSRGDTPQTCHPAKQGAAPAQARTVLRPALRGGLRAPTLVRDTPGRGQGVPPHPRGVPAVPSGGSCSARPGGSVPAGIPPARPGPARSTRGSGWQRALPVPAPLTGLAGKPPAEHPCARCRRHLCSQQEPCRTRRCQHSSRS